jgi:hypothetical protein
MSAEKTYHPYRGKAKVVFEPFNGDEAKRSVFEIDGMHPDWLDVLCTWVAARPCSGAFHVVQNEPMMRQMLVPFYGDFEVDSNRLHQFRAEVRRAMDLLDDLGVRVARALDTGSGIQLTHAELLEFQTGLCVRECSENYCPMR